MNKYIVITRAGYKLGEEKVRSPYSSRTRRIQTEEAKARVISPSLAIYQYEKGTDWYGARYHVIHISTGLVIADVEYKDVKTVKATFEAERWTFKSGDYMTFHLIPKHKGTLRSFSITCRIRYDVREQANDE